MTSAAQLAANRRNAEKSTGPHTYDGKKRSAMNAIKHGAYVQQYGSIEATILEENHEAVQALIQALIHDLDPETPVEFMLAESIAQKIVGQQRVDRLASHLASSQELDRFARDALDGDYHDVLVFWETIGKAMEVLEGRVDGKVKSETLAREFHSRVPTSQSLKSRYSTGDVREPATDGEWDAKLISMVDGIPGYAEFGVDVIAEFQQLAWDEVLRQERTAAGIEAKRLLDQFRDLTDVQDRVERGVARQLKDYWELKDRNATAATRNEPNPTM